VCMQNANCAAITSSSSTCSGSDFFDCNKGSVIGPLTGLLFGFLIRIVYRVLKNATWRGHEVFVRTHAICIHLPVYTLPATRGFDDESGCRAQAL
jgi:hypothetical protein